MPTNVPSGMVTHGPVTGAVTGQITRGHVSGHQSIMTASSNNLQLGVNDQHQPPKTDAPSHHQSALAHNVKGISNKVVNEIQSQGAVHSRTKSDANYIQSLHVQNTNKNNFVISSSNHVVYPGQNPSSVGSKKTHQSKKASNLKTMNNNNVSSQGATKGLLGFSNKTKFVKVNQEVQGQLQEAAAKHHQQSQVKKTQIQNIVRSNLKNAARNDDEGGGVMRGPQSISNNA